MFSKPVRDVDNGLGRLGGGGHQKKTIEGHNNAKRQFNKFIDFAKLNKCGVGPAKLFKYYKDADKG